MLEYSYSKTLFFTKKRRYIYDDIGISSIQHLDSRIENLMLDATFKRFPDSKAVASLERKFDTISDILDLDETHFLACLSCKSIFRKIQGSTFRQLGETVLRITLTQRDGTVSYNDLPYVYDLEENIRQIKEVVSTQRRFAKLECDPSFSWTEFDTVILAPRSAAYLVHEIFGHLFEYDYVQSGMSLIKEKDKGKLIFPDHITIKEAPLNTQTIGLVFGKTDDIGNSLSNTTIIQDGVLEHFVCNQRVASYSSRPLYRMHNLYLEGNPTGTSLYTIIANTAHGLLVNQALNAYVNTENGRFFYIL